MTATESATATDTDAASATDTETASATDTDGTSASDTVASDTDTVGSDTDGTTGDSAGTDTDADMCLDDPGDGNCVECMKDGCCDAYTACQEDDGCLCLLSKCVDAVNTLGCALTQCQLNALEVPQTLGFLLSCAGPCGLTCPVLNLL